MLIIVNSEVGLESYQKFIISKDNVAEPDMTDFSDANFGSTLSTLHLGMHWFKLMPHHRSSDPHAESHEEEFVYVVSGRPHVWINGYIYQLEPGLCVGFPAGTGIAHTFINNINEPVEMIVLGDRTKKENKCAFPINPERNNNPIWWDNYPKHELGPHDGKIGNINYQKEWRELPFIKQVSTLERKIGFSYPTDTEKFTEGVRLTDQVGLKSLGVWHEVMKPGRRSSWPHAHKFEEEAAILLKGSAKVWLNGFIYNLNPGDCVFFKPGTGIAHVLINDSSENVEFLGIGQANDGGPDEKIIYPLHQTRNEQCITNGYFWNDCTEQTVFGNDFGIPKIDSIEVKFESSAKEFLDKTSPLLELREAEYSLLYGLCELRAFSKKVPDDYKYISIFQSKQLIGAALITDKRLIITALQEPQIEPLVSFLKLNNVTVPGVVGPALTADAFSRMWSKATNQKCTLAMGQKIYQLTEVIMPPNISGKLKLAQESDVSFVGQWLLEFSIESLPHQPTTIEKMIELAKIKIQKQETYLWLDKNNMPVSMSLVGRPTKNGISVSGVYTPKNLRKNGFASALVAQTSQNMLCSGKKFCVLYTDTANPTSNKIYQQVGYKEVATSKDFTFSSALGS